MINNENQNDVYLDCSTTWSRDLVAVKWGLKLYFEGSFICVFTVIGTSAILSVVFLYGVFWFLTLWFLFLKSWGNYKQ